ncbi:uncharacterized protein LOC8269019 [Ricinus communis]|uniref:uncharacterized protein LOC8269019 n=1 Tax=Ricinus communis TaxID=3988 RepID=UPI000772939C|nr:uncharacterized protein LOC8269019 [Ricinus communis]|eukprot:XP_015582129.1 uncharacterized protein LOC8269019 [Ricinus communis]
MDNNGPFASIAELCHISSSQEELLKRCRFAGEPETDESLSDESGENDDTTPVESTGIMMISPPESPEEEEEEDHENIPRDNDVFHTPPEESTLATSQEHELHQRVDSHEDRMVLGDEKIEASLTDNDSTAVDLGRDTDLGFSTEVELTERIEVDSGTDVNSILEGEDFRVLKRELDSSNGLCGSFSGKRVKIVDINLERIVKSIEKLRSPSKISKLVYQNLVLETVEAENLGKSVENSSPSNSPNNHQIQQVNGGDNREFNGDSSAKRKLEFCAYGVVESEMGENSVGLGFNKGRIEDGTEEIEDDDSERCLDASSAEKRKEREAKSIDDIDKFRYVPPTNANSLEKQKCVGAKRALPMSMCVNNGCAESEVVPDGVPSPKSYEEVVFTLLEVLKMLSDGHDCDPALEHLSIVEVAKMRGMTFP